MPQLWLWLLLSVFTQYPLLLCLPALFASDILAANELMLLLCLLKGWSVSLSTEFLINLWKDFFMKLANGTVHKIILVNETVYKMRIFPFV